MPKYTFNINNRTYNVDSERELTEQDKQSLVSDIQRQQTKQKIKDLPSNLKNTALNLGRKVGHGLTFGQGAHVEGLGNALGNALYNKLHGEETFKDFGKNYVEGRERTKKEYKQFDEEHPFLSIGAEIVGSLPTGTGLTKLTKVGKLAKILNTPTRGVLEGAGYGAAYGASNTEGKGFDTGGAVTGGIIGGTVGGGLGLLGSGIRNLTTKDKKDLSKIGTNIKDLVNSPEKMFLEQKGQNLKLTPQEYLEKAEQAKLKGDILAENDYRQKAKQLLDINKKGKVATVGDVAADENIPYHLLKTVDDWKIKAEQGDARALNLLDEVSNKQFSVLNEQYKNDLVKNLSDVLPTIKNIGEEIYKPFNNATFVADDKAILSAINSIEDKAVRDRATKALNKILNKPKKVVPTQTQPEIVNGWQILPKQTTSKQISSPVTMQELREAKQELYDLAQEILETAPDGHTTVSSSLGGQKAINYYNNLRKLISDQAGSQIEGLRAADKLYSSMLDANMSLASVLGKKLDKGNVLNKFLADLRNKSIPETSNMLNKVENKLNEVANTFKGTAYENQINKFKSLIENINDNSKLFQMSYALQPQDMIQTVGKRINTRKALKMVLDEMNNPQNNFYNFVKYAKAGAINEPAEKAASDFGRTTIERKAAQRRLFSKPKNSLFTNNEKAQINKNLLGFYNKRFRNIVNNLNNAEILPKATIRSIMQQYYK